MLNPQLWSHPINDKSITSQICKEFQNGNKCEKLASECPYAHPPASCPLDADGTLAIVCVDFIKGKCSRETCKYFHPPAHLISQLKKQKQSNSALAAQAVAAANAAAFLSTASYVPFSTPYLSLGQMTNSQPQQPYRAYNTPSSSSSSLSNFNYRTQMNSNHSLPVNLNSALLAAHQTMNSSASNANVYRLVQSPIGSLTSSHSPSGTPNSTSTSNTNKVNILIYYYIPIKPKPPLHLLLLITNKQYWS